MIKHFAETGRNQDLFSSKYDNFILPGDFNSEPCEQSRRDFRHAFKCQNIIKDKACFKNPHNLRVWLVFNEQTKKFAKFYSDRDRFV